MFFNVENSKNSVKKLDGFYTKIKHLIYTFITLIIYYYKNYFNYTYIR